MNLDNPVAVLFKAIAGCVVVMLASAMLVAVIAAIACFCSGCAPPPSDPEPECATEVDAGSLALVTSTDCYSAAASLSKCCALHGGIPDGGWVVTYDEAPVGACSGMVFQGRHLEPLDVLLVDTSPCSDELAKEECQP